MIRKSVIRSAALLATWSLAPAPAMAGGVDPDAEWQQRVATANVARGKLLFLQCGACHAVEAGAPAKVGPSLHGMFGRKAGTLAGFTFSDALRKSSIVWTPAALEQWLMQPGKFVPGTTMAFAGVPKEADRTNLIAYLLQATSANAAR